MPLTRIFDFHEGSHDQTVPAPGGGLHLGDGATEGCWTSPVYQRAGQFDWAVASWNAAGEHVEILLRVAGPREWSPWFSYGQWSQTGDRRSLEEQNAPGVGKLSTDTLVLERPTAAWQVRVVLRGAALTRLWIATALRSHRAPDAPNRKAWGVDLPVPLRSQMIYPNGGRVWCSPTSLAMVLAYYGRDLSIPDEVVPGVYDSVYEGHGNWPFNTAYAGAQGFVAYVDRFAGFADLEDWVAAGFPVIASVAYKKEWLENAPIDQTGGHILVVRGFTPEGDVIVNDPAAAEDSGVRLVYKRDQFKRAWLDRGGVVYLVCPA